MHSDEKTRIEPTKDDKGRIDVLFLSDRQLLEEIVLSQRATQDLVEQFIASMSRNPMMKMMAGKFGM